MFRELIRAQEGAKAFPYRVELTDAGGPLYSGGAPATYNDYNGGMGGGRIRTPLQQREAPLHMQTYGGREPIDWLMGAVDFTATSAASADYHFEDDKGAKYVVSRKPADTEEVKDAPLLLAKLFAEPNPYMSWTELCEISLIDWLIVGNAYWVKWQMNGAGQPLALYRMAPDCVRIIPGQFGPEAYRYRLPGQREEVEFKPEQIVHFRRTNPNSPYYGLGIVQGGARALDMELALTNTMAHYYENRSLPSGVVQTERRVPRDVFRKLKAQLRNFYGGGDNAGKLMVLEAGLKFEAVSPSAQDALFQEMGGWSRDRILSMFHMNKGLLGIADKGSADPKLADWQLLFDRKTMIPLVKKFSIAVSRGLVTPAWNLKFKIDYEETLPPDQVLSRAQTLAPLPGVKVHELRAAAGLPPSTGDKTIDETVLNMPLPNMDASGKGGGADANLKSEPGRPPIAANTSSFGSTAQTPPQRKPAKKPTGTATPGKKALDDEFTVTSNATEKAKERFDEWVKERPPTRAIPPRQTEEKSVEEIVAELDARIEELDTKALPPADHVHVGKLAGDHVTSPLMFDLQSELEDAVHQLERDLLDAAEGKAEGTLYQRVKNSKAWVVFEERLSSVLEGGAVAAAAQANVGRSADEVIDYDEVGAATLLRSGGLSDTLNTLKKQVLDSMLTVQRAGSAASKADQTIRETLRAWKEADVPGVAHETVNFALNYVPSAAVTS